MTTTTYTQAVRSLVEAAEGEPHGSGQRLAYLHAAVRELEAEIAGQVAAARAEGMTWQAVGACLGGISKQAAQQRYGG